MSEDPINGRTRHEPKMRLIGLSVQNKVYLISSTPIRDLHHEATGSITARKGKGATYSISLIGSGFPSSVLYTAAIEAYVRVFTLP